MVQAGDDKDAALSSFKGANCDPYERKLIEIQNSYDLPPPPPEFLRLIRDRAELKAKCLLFQADQNKQLHLLSTDQEQVSKFENSKFSAEQCFGLEFPFYGYWGLN